jgi:hypothetical protein
MAKWSRKGGVSRPPAGRERGSRGELGPEAGEDHQALKWSDDDITREVFRTMRAGIVMLS